MDTPERFCYHVTKEDNYVDKVASLVHVFEIFEKKKKKEMETPKRIIGKQCRPRSDTAKCGI